MKRELMSAFVHHSRFFSANDARCTAWSKPFGDECASKECLRALRPGEVLEGCCGLGICAST